MRLPFALVTAAVVLSGSALRSLVDGLPDQVGE